MSMMATTLSIKELVSNSLVSIPFIPKPLKPSAEWIPIRPNTDVALMLGMMHYLYMSNQYDKAFIVKYTDGFDKFLPYLLGESDNAPKTLEWASQITGVSAEKIKELADLFVSKHTFLAGNWAM